MLTLPEIKQVYMLGIGGIGMSAIARYFKAAGREVCGYDRTPTVLTAELEREGISVHYTDDITSLPDFLSGNDVNREAIVIFTPAIPKDHQEYNHLLRIGYRLWKRSEVLGLITRNAYTIAVAGTHGKTTTSTMIAHILKFNAVNCTAFLGGISNNYHTNLLLASQNDQEIVVVEADEFDRSFLTLFPDIAVITSLDADHLDIYGNRESMVASYSEFAGQVKKEGSLICRYGLELTGGVQPAMTYSIDHKASYRAFNVRVENHNYVFDIDANGEQLQNIELSWPGRHNVENATGAIAACHTFGIPLAGIRSALHTFIGVKRRFDYQLRTDRIVFIDDYAHHPEELKAAIRSVKELYPRKIVLGIFQPHLFSRTRDFAAGFAQSLSYLDELILLDIYPAREKPIEGVTSKIIFDAVSISAKRMCRKEELISSVLESNADIVLSLGAGDIDEWVPEIKKALEKKYLNQTA